MNSIWNYFFYLTDESMTSVFKSYQKITMLCHDGMLWMYIIIFGTLGQIRNKWADNFLLIINILFMLSQVENDEFIFRKSSFSWLSIEWKDCQGIFQCSWITVENFNYEWKSCGALRMLTPQWCDSVTPKRKQRICSFFYFISAFGYYRLLRHLSK